MQHDHPLLVSLRPLLKALGATVVSLGPCVMRIEMAAIAGSALLRA